MTKLDPLDALELWRSLSGDSWVLLDRYDRDGHEVLVARRVLEPAAPSRVLTAREREVVAAVGRGCANKEVAFELGLSTATVATLLGRATRKLGLGSRLEIVALLATTAEVTE